MKQKTINFDDVNFKIEKGELMKCQYKNNTYNEEGAMEWVDSAFQIGVEVTLFSTHNIKTKNPMNYQITIDDGIGGNLNHNIRQYHGWRGTTSDIAVYAHGKRKITKITQRRGKIYITVGRDILPGEK